MNDLCPNTPYKISFNAASELGRSGPSSEEFIITTNAYTEPQNLRMLERNDSAISISWEPPQFVASNTNIVSYDVDILDPLGGRSIKNQTFEVQTEQNSFQMEITGLEHSSKYIIEVMPRSNHTYTKESHITRLGTKAIIQVSTLPKAPQAPNVINTTHHTISLRWEPPERMIEGTRVTSYLVRYDRIDPESGKPLIPGGEKTAYTSNNEIILKDMAAGGTFRMEVKVTTTDGSSTYSASTISSTPIIKTELDEFRDSLNLGDIEESLTGNKNDKMLLN